MRLIVVCLAGARSCNGHAQLIAFCVRRIYCDGTVAHQSGCCAHGRVSTVGGVEYVHAVVCFGNGVSNNNLGGSLVN